MVNNSSNDSGIIRSEKHFFSTLESAQSLIQVFHFQIDVEECKIINNAIKEMQSDPTFATVDFFHVDSENCQGLLTKYNIKYLPVILLFHSRQYIDMVEGFNIPEFMSKLKKCLSNDGLRNSEEVTIDQIKRIINSNNVVLFMKGLPNEPKCGFSGEAVELLNANGIPFTGFDVLSNENIRQGLKTFSDWPTFPQLYVNQTFIGGLDIMKQMAETGELRALPKKDTDWNDDKLRELVNKQKVMIFIKGTREEPRCKFSRTALNLLNQTKVDYGVFDILSNETVRQKLKKFSEWPTYPQLYVNGKLIGGVDIMMQLYEDGELVKTLQS